MYTHTVYSVAPVIICVIVQTDGPRVQLLRLTERETVTGQVGYKEQSTKYAGTDMYADTDPPDEGSRTPPADAYRFISFSFSSCFVGLLCWRGRVVAWGVGAGERGAHMYTSLCNLKFRTTCCACVRGVKGSIAITIEIVIGIAKRRWKREREEQSNLGGGRG